MDYEGIEQAIKAEIGSGPDATEIMKYIEDCPQSADGWTELVVMAGDDDKSIYSERFGNLIFNWKDAIVDGVPAILDILNPNVLLAIVKIGRAYRTLVNLFHVDLGEDEAKVVRALWLDMRAVVEVPMAALVNSSGLPPQRAEAAVRNLERLKVVSRSVLGMILRRDSIRVLPVRDRTPIG